MSSPSRSKSWYVDVIWFALAFALFLLPPVLRYYEYRRESEPVKPPEFSISHLNITNLESNSWSAITVDIQVQSHCDIDITYHSMSVYALKDERVISEVSMPAFRQESRQSLALKARMVLPNGSGVGFNYWSDQGGVFDFDVRVSAIVDLKGMQELRITCEGIGVGFEKGMDGSMLGHFKNCSVHVQKNSATAGFTQSINNKMPSCSNRKCLFYRKSLIRSRKEIIGCAEHFCKEFKLVEQVDYGMTLEYATQSGINDELREVLH